jgi:acyl-CoA synthetase (AMP-forming)/AMP-acid ligase II
MDSIGSDHETNVVQRLMHTASGALRNKVVYTFLDDAGKETVNYSFADVDMAARRIAATLQIKGGITSGDRVVLCFPPGLDFAMAFWGCLYAGAVAVPMYPPFPTTLTKDLPTFNRVVCNTDARVILTNRKYRWVTKATKLQGLFRSKRHTAAWPKNVHWITSNSIRSCSPSRYDSSKAQQLTLDDLAFLQQTSGSTGPQKPTMVSHRNLCAQLQSWDTITPEDTLVSWLPSYHDMGLVGSIVAPCVFSSRCVSMSPTSFLKDPTLWMQAVTTYRATHVCGPAFAYALVARKTTQDRAKTMDLRTLKQTICAAGHIRAESLKAFITTFEVAGFDPKTFNCGYGLAEATLVCTGQDPRQRNMPTLLRVSRRTLEIQQCAVVVEKLEKEANPKQTAADVVTLVGCGKPMPTFSIAIVDPSSKKQLEAEGQIGEVWIQGPSVATGYWNKADETTQTFGALLLGETNESNTFCRSGDLGFLHNGELFVTARLKDLMILRGRHIAPQRVEETVERAHQEIRPGCVAAFTIKKNHEQALIVVAEVRNGSAKDDEYVTICLSIQGCLLVDHRLRCEAIVLLPAKSIPKTTSGKLQRGVAKAQFQGRMLTKPLYEYAAEEETDDDDALSPYIELITTQL